MSRQLFEYINPRDAKVRIFESEDEAGKKSLGMEGIFVQAEQRNQNGRVYPLAEIKKAVDEIDQRIRKGETVMGELDHPPELQINLDRVSHIIQDMWMDGNNGIGKLKLIDTPMGNIASALMKAGAALGVSSRGSGNVSDNGIVDGFECVTVDIVAQPSAPDAYPKPVYESLFNMRGGAVLHRTAAAVTHDKSAEKHLMKGLESFIRELNLK
jgi:hypothetical protein